MILRISSHIFLVANGLFMVYKYIPSISFTIKSIIWLKTYTIQASKSASLLFSYLSIIFQKRSEKVAPHVVIILFIREVFMTRMLHNSDCTSFFNNYSLFEITLWNKNIFTDKPC